MKTYPPTVLIKPIERKPTSEQLKYERMWEFEEYRAIAPGEQCAHTFLAQAKPIKNSTCIDFGCGTGRGSLMLALFGQMAVTMVDFAHNALDEDVKNATITQPDRISWMQADLNHPLPIQAAYGYCTDVMEHIPPSEVDKVLRNIFAAAPHVFFQISCQEDNCGKMIDEELHLTIQTYEWWIKKFREHNAHIHWSQVDDNGNACQIYATTWVQHKDVEYDGKVNTELEIVREHVRKNAETEWLPIHPHPLQETEVMMLCGGPSLLDYTDEIIKLRAQGMPMITTNGTYNWAIENGMKPSMQLIIDSREFNKRFTRPLIDDCKYVFASQCHPSLFEGMPQDRTYIWHVTLTSDIEDLLDELYEIWFPCPGGSTVTLRGLCLLRMLGFHKIHLYGFDSCLRGEDHHAYSQPENDYKTRPIPISVGGRVFYCDPWMFSQAQEFMGMVGLFGDEIDLNVKGDGLIAHIITTGAELSALEKLEQSED
jgi:SAM-dependent methyltransferase